MKRIINKIKDLKLPKIKIKRKFLVILATGIIAFIGISVLTYGFASGKLVYVSQPYKDLEFQLGEAKAKSNELETQITQLNETIVTINSKITQDQTEKSELDIKVNNLTAEISQAEKDIYNYYWHTYKPALDKYYDYLVMEQIINRGPDIIALYRITINMAEVKRMQAITYADQVAKYDIHQGMIANKDAKINDKNASVNRQNELNEEIKTLDTTNTENANRIQEYTTNNDNLKNNINNLEANLIKERHWTQKVQNKILNVYYKSKEIFSKLKSIARFLKFTKENLV